MPKHAFLRGPVSGLFWIAEARMTTALAMRKEKQKARPSARATRTEDPCGYIHDRVVIDRPERPSAPSSMPPLVVKFDLFHSACAI